MKKSYDLPKIILNNLQLSQKRQNDPNLNHFNFGIKQEINRWMENEPARNKMQIRQNPLFLENNDNANCIILKDALLKYPRRAELVTFPDFQYQKGRFFNDKIDSLNQIFKITEKVHQFPKAIKLIVIFRSSIFKRQEVIGFPLSQLGYVRGRYDKADKQRKWKKW